MVGLDKRLTMTSRMPRPVDVAPCQVMRWEIAMPLCLALLHHPVVNKNGKLGGYGGLPWRKEALLQLENGLPFGQVG